MQLVLLMRFFGSILKLGLLFRKVFLVVANTNYLNIEKKCGNIFKKHVVSDLFTYIKTLETTGFPFVGKICSEEPKYYIRV